MLGLSDVARTSRVRSLTARELPVAGEGYLVYCNNNFEEQFNYINYKKKVKNYMILVGKTVIPLLLMFLCLVMSVVCLSILSFMLKI